MKLLVVLSRFPYPLVKGDKLRAFHQLKYLSRHHEIYLVTLNDQRLPEEDINMVKSFCKELHIIQLNWRTKFVHLLFFLFKGLPLQCGYFYSRKAKRTIDRLMNTIKPDHIYGQMIRVAEYIKTAPVRKTIDYQDVLSKGIYRRYKKASFFVKPFLYLEYKRLIRYEAAVFPYFDHHTIITGVDRDLIPHPEFQKIEVVANGVDFDKYAYKGQSKIYDLIFTGNMGYAPNIDAAEYLARQIFPELKKSFPEITLVICGANPSYKIRALADRHITVTGWVDSIADYYAQSRIFIAPMQMGTGLQNKILEAMATGLPCITSSLAGKPLENIKSGKEIIICNSTTGYVESVALLLNDPDLYREMGMNGLSFAQANYNWENTTKKLENIMMGIQQDYSTNK